jgi:hypothetical protein
MLTFKTRSRSFYNSLEAVLMNDLSELPSMLTGIPLNYIAHNLCAAKIVEKTGALFSNEFLIILKSEITCPP